MPLKAQEHQSTPHNPNRRGFMLGVAAVIAGIVSSGCDDDKGKIRANTPFSIATDHGGGEESAIKGSIQKSVDKIISYLARDSINPWNKQLADLGNTEFREELINGHNARIETLPGMNNKYKLTIEYSGITYICNGSTLECSANKSTTLTDLKDALEELTRLL